MTLLVASCTFESTRGAAESVHDTLSSVHDCVESLLDVLFSAVLGNFHDAYEEFVNTLESIVGWYVDKIVMIRMFFGRGEVQGLHVFTSVPPVNLPDSFLHGRTGCSTRRSPVARNRTCVLIVDHEQGPSMTRSEAPLIFSKCRGRFRERLQRSRERQRCCGGPILFYVARDQFSSIFKELQFLIVLLRVAHAFAWDHFS